MMNQTSRGITLFELMLASALGLAVIVAVGQLDVSRTRLHEQISATAGSEAVLALAHMGRNLEQADRINRLNASDVQFRIAHDPDHLGDATGYQWSQYRLIGHDIVFYHDVGDARTEPDCTEDERFHEIAALNVQYRDAASAPPPGGEPGGGFDNNVLEIYVRTEHPQTGAQTTYTGEATLRASAYTALLTGLSGPGVSEPPASCP